MASTRVDRWLWAVRLTRTRPDAATACRGGHVRINDRPAKPSTTVAPGDEVRARLGDRTRIVEVVRVIQKRVGAADAVTCFVDRSPARTTSVTVPVAVRERGAGRPTKRDRRALDRWRASRDQAGSLHDDGSHSDDLWDDDHALHPVDGWPNAGASREDDRVT